MELLGRFAFIMASAVLFWHYEGHGIVFGHDRDEGKVLVPRGLDGAGNTEEKEKK